MEAINYWHTIAHSILKMAIISCCQFMLTRDGTLVSRYFVTTTVIIEPQPVISILTHRIESIVKWSIRNLEYTKFQSWTQKSLRQTYPTNRFLPTNPQCQTTVFPESRSKYNIIHEREIRTALTRKTATRNASSVTVQKKSPCKIPVTTTWSGTLGSRVLK